MSSLYLGTGELEQELVNCLKAAGENNPSLRTTILLDYCRGNRINNLTGPKSSKELLQPLVSPKFDVSFYLSPEFNTWFKRKFIFPRPKWNEIIALQHMKCFVFDDNIVISGANLSEQYFMNRHDRYVCIYECKPLCDYFDDLIKTVSHFSMQLARNGTFNVRHDWGHHPLDSDKSVFCDAARRSIRAFQTRHPMQPLAELQNEPTFVIPLLQMKSFAIDDDQLFTSNLLSNTTDVTELRVASGYFNLTNHYIDVLAKRKTTSTCDVLMASEQVNSFFGSRGLIGYIPSVYTQVGREFFRTLKAHQSNIKLWSFYRPNWTFHAKGLWLRFADKYMLTTIGSPNFGYRSVNRDLEAQLIIVTRDEQLKSKLVDEHEHLWKYAKHIKSEDDLPNVPQWVRLITPIIKTFF